MLRLVAAALVVLMLVPASSAFDSLPNGPHDDITGAAATNAGYPEAGIAALKQAVRGPDIRDSKLDPKADKVTNFDVTADYAPRHHCDRLPPATDQESFNATVEYVKQQGDLALNSSHAGNATGAVTFLGAALHAMEDCFSHSNAVDLAQPDVVVLAVQGRVPPPEGLKLTGFLPGAHDPEHPDGDPYPHGDFAKDSPNKNDESATRMADNRTKFEHARSLATDAATMFLGDWLKSVPAAEQAALANVTAAKEDAGLPKLHVPSLPFLPVVGALALVFALARRR